MATQGNLTMVEVSDDNIAFHPICTYGKEATVEYGKYSISKEFCLSSDDPEIALGEKDYSDRTYSHLWEEGNGSAGNLVVKTAYENKTKIFIRVTANNSAGANGTQYTSEFMVNDYKHMFKKAEVNKTEWSCSQMTEPVEVASA